MPLLPQFPHSLRSRMNFPELRSCPKGYQVSIWRVLAYRRTLKHWISLVDIYSYSPELVNWNELTKTRWKLISMLAEEDDKRGRFLMNRRIEKQALNAAAEREAELDRIRDAIKPSMDELMQLIRQTS